MRLEHSINPASYPAAKSGRAGYGRRIGLATVPLHRRPPPFNEHRLPFERKIKCFEWPIWSVLCISSYSEDLLRARTKKGRQLFGKKILRAPMTAANSTAPKTPQSNSVWLAGCFTAGRNRDRIQYQVQPQCHVAPAFARLFSRFIIRMSARSRPLHQAYVFL